MKKYLIIAAFLCGFQVSSNAQENVVIVSDAWSRPITIEGRPGGAYLNISNQTEEADQLLSVSSTVSPRLEIHEHSMTDGVMKMSRVDFVEIPANQKVEFKPGGYHIMIFDSKKYEIGDDFELVLTFKNAGDIATKVQVSMKKPNLMNE
jgi:periplasmic copper chaperone A